MFTRGNWKSDGLNVHSSNDRFVATCGCNGPNQHRVNAENEANATLISAAPELLKACKASRKILLQNRALNLCQGSEYVYILKLLEQAISKATINDA